MLSTHIFKYFAAFFLAMVIFGCKNTIQEVEELSNTDTPNSTAKNFTFTFSDSAKIKFQITAPEVITKNKNGIEYLREFTKGITVLSFNEQGKQSSDLRADYAIQYIDSNLWKAQKNVIVLSNDGRKIETEEAYWDMNRKLIYTDADVVIDEKGDLIYGKGMLADQNLNMISIYQTSGTVLIDKANFEPDSIAASKKEPEDSLKIIEPQPNFPKQKIQFKKLIKDEQ